MPAADHHGTPRPADRLEVRKKGRIEFVAVADLLYAQGADNYAELRLRNGRSELLDCTLARLATFLPDDFARIHKSYLVRLSAVKRLHVRAGSRYTAELFSGQLLPVGRTRYQAIRDRLCG